MTLQNSISIIIIANKEKFGLLERASILNVYSLSCIGKAENLLKFSFLFHFLPSLPLHQNVFKEKCSILIFQQSHTFYLNYLERILFGVSKDNRIPHSEEQVLSELLGLPFNSKNSVKTAERSIFVIQLKYNTVETIPWKITHLYYRTT